jgi:hypothetical protein
MQGMAHEIWLNRWGMAIDQREPQVGTEGLTSLERLIHILWLISQSMRANGDLVAARRRDPSLFRTVWQRRGRSIYRVSLRFLRRVPGGSKLISSRNSTIFAANCSRCV